MSDYDDSKAKKDSSSWKKSSKHLSTSLLNLNHDDYEEKDAMKMSKNLNSSTLSLHIAAYEDSNESVGNSDHAKNEGSKKKDEKSRDLIRKWDKAKQFFSGSLSFIQVILNVN